MRDKEYLVAIRPYKNIFLLTTLHYEYELKKMPVSDFEQPNISTKELKLAEQLITDLSEKDLNLARYKDSFATELIKQISKQKKGKALPTKKEAFKKQPNLL